MATIPISTGGVITQNLAQAVTGTATSIATIGAQHNYVLIQNIGTGDVYIAFNGAAPTFGTGFLLKGGGGVFEFTGFIPTGTISAISSSNLTSTLAVLIA